MSQLHRMTIRKQSFRVHADDRVVEHHRLEVMTGVPSHLVATWKRDFPEAVVSVAEDENDKSAKRRTKRFDRLTVTKAARSQNHRGTSAGSKPHTVSPPVEQNFDLASLINQAVKELGK